MPAIIPQLSDQQRNARLQALRENPIYPISTQWSVAVTTANFATADVSTLGQYRSNAILLPYNYGIVGLRLSCALLSDDALTPYLCVAVSYSSIFTVAAYGGAPTVPDEMGNVLYRAAINDAAFNETLWVKNGDTPDNFFVAANNNVYVHLWATTALLTAADVTAQGFLTLYVAHTGIRT